MGNNRQVKQVKEKALFILSMLIFGTIGVVRRNITLPSGFIAVVRGFSGALFLAAVLFIRRQKIGLSGNRKRFLLLVLSGVFIGVNWVLLFESYNYTTVAAATLCYYMAPVFYMFAGRILFGERLTVKKLLCAAAAVAGMVLVSGVALNGSARGKGAFGIALGLGAAVFYASVMIINKKTSGAEPFGKTVIQLFAAAAVVVPYTLLFEKVQAADFSLNNILLLILIGFIYTGAAYLVYFSSLQKLPSQTAAILCYIDPAAAVVISAIVLNERLTFTSLTGAVLIIGAAAVSEINIKKKN